MIALNQFALDNITPLQWEDARFAIQNGRVVFGHKTGDGKSLLAIIAWATWPDVKRVLILGGKSAATTWNSQPMLWADTQVSFLSGSAVERAPIWEEVLSAPEGVWYSTYSTFHIHMKAEKKRWNPHWDLVICDELHKLRNRGTQLYSSARRMRFDKFVGLSATWASRGPQDLWAVLHLLNPKVFSSYWAFVDEYCFVIDEMFGKSIVGVKNLDKLKAHMNGSYYRSRKGAAPPTTRELVQVEMEPAQAKLYKQLDAEMWAESGGNLVVTPTGLAKLTRLMQLAAFPQLLFPNLGPGPAIEHIVECIEDDPHTVIFTFFTEAIPLIEKALRTAGNKNIFALKGGTKMEQVDQTVKEWKDTRGIMICSIKFAESFRIDTSHTAYVLSFSFDPNENIQAEGRLRARDSVIQTPPLVKYYIVQNTVMEAVQEICNGKARTMSQIFDDYAIMHRKEQNAS